MSKPKVLVFIDWYLPGYKAGGPIQSCANAISLLENHIDFYVLTSAFDYQSIAPYPNINTNEWVSLNNHKVKYLSGKFFSGIKETLSEFDWKCIWINGIWSPFFSLLPLQLTAGKKTRKVVSSRGMFAIEAMKIKQKRKLFTLQITKNLGLYKNVHWHFTEQGEQERAATLLPVKNHVIIPNVGKMANLEDPILPFKSVNELKLLYVGRISEEKNTHFAVQVLQNISKPITLNIVGQENAGDYPEKCKALASLASHHQIKFLGAKPQEEIFKLMDEHHFLFLPSKGENFGHAIHEAINRGLPVIISDKTPFKNLSEKGIGYDLPLLMEEFIDVIESCLSQSQQEHHAMRLKAFTFGRQNNNLEKIQGQYLKLFTANE
jgi:glycosyltransferase involved in cell wall biosynthesis